MSNVIYTDTLNSVQILSLTVNKRTVRLALTLCKPHLLCSVGTGGVVEVIPPFTSTAQDKFTWIPLCFYFQMRRVSGLAHKPTYADSVFILHYLCSLPVSV